MLNWLHYQWFTYWWPSDKGNGPEAVQQTIVYAAIAVVLVPPVRHFFKRHFDAVHAKLDHIITNHPDIPEFQMEVDKWEHWLVKAWKWVRSKIHMPKGYL